MKGRCPRSNKVYSNKIVVSVGHLVKSLSVFTWLVEGGGFVFLRLHALGTLLSSWCLCCQCLQITKRWCKGQRIDNIWWRHHYHCVSCEYPVLTCYHTLSVIPSALCIPSAVGTQSMMDAAFVSLKAKFDIQVFFLYAKCQSCVVYGSSNKKT